MFALPEEARNSGWMFRAALQSFACPAGKVSVMKKFGVHFRLVEALAKKLRSHCLHPLTCLSRHFPAMAVEQGDSRFPKISNWNSEVGSPAGCYNEDVR